MNIPARARAFAEATSASEDVSEFSRVTHSLSSSEEPELPEPELEELDMAPKSGEVDATCPL